MPILRKLKEFLDANGVRFTALRHPPAFTAEGVAAAQHVPPQELVRLVEPTVDDYTIGQGDG
jgi:Ala-tRNA(Pro) deacylase